MPRRKKEAKRPLTALARELKRHRDEHDLTQEELAFTLDTDPRNLRRWENGEVILQDMGQLKWIADRLGIPYERLGITPSIYTPLSPEGINTTVARVWSLIDAALIADARAVGENLIREIHPQITVNDSEFVRAVTSAFQAVAFATCLNVRTEEVQQAIDYFQQMEYFARLLNDDTLVNVALTYQGDMLRRKGDVLQAIEYLEAVRDAASESDKIVRGNALQLLARAYLQANRAGDFEDAMKQTEELALATKEETYRPVRRYDLTTVYEEYAKSYGRLGKIQPALDYIALAETVRPPTKISELLVKVTRADILIRSGDVRNGEPLAVEAAIYCKKHGHYRHLERLYAIKRYLNRQSFNFGKAERALGEALEGPIEY